MLFKIECKVEEKKLGKVLSALDGLVVDMEPPVPIRNAVATSNGVKSTADDRPIPECFSFSGLKEVSVDQIKNTLKALGRSPTSYGYAIQKLRKAKVLAPAKGKGMFKVLKASVYG